jgi:hypothetical protein
MDEHGAVIQWFARPLPLLQNPEDNRHLPNSGEKVMQCPVMGLHKGGALKKILGRIAAQGQFRENGQCAARLFSSLDLLGSLPAIQGKIADNGIHLDKCCFHRNKDLFKSSEIYQELPVT